MNPVDEFLEYEKTAQIGSFLRGVGKGLTALSRPIIAAGDKIPANQRAALAAMRRGVDLGQQMQTGAAVAAGGAMLTGVGLAAKKINDAINKRREFKAMMDIDPEMTALRDSDTPFFHAAYTSLRTVNPTFGRDPLTASALMRNMMANKDIAGQVLMHSVKPPEPLRDRPTGLGVSVPLGAMSFHKNF